MLVQRSPSDRGKPCRSRVLRRSRRPLNGNIVFEKTAFLSCLLFFLLSIVANGQTSHEPQCKPQEPTKYDWEKLNYYELLGLAEEKGTKSKTKKRKRGHAPSNGDEKDGKTILGIKEIRKAYRKQAQKYHPDKQISKKKQTGEGSAAKSSSKTEPLSVEESNARFSKIAEAYNFLLDETKRTDYDLFLEYCQSTEIVEDDEGHEGRLSTILKKRFHGLFDDLVGSRDPFKVFKDVFFGGDDDNDDDDFYFDPNDPFSHLRYENNPQRHPNHQQHYPDEEPYDPDEEPTHVFHEKRFMYDPITGENVVRVLQTEEFAPKEARGNTRAGNSTASPSFYYRIIAQDFREQYDPYDAKEVYVPIIEPYLQEDGFRTASASRDQTAESSSSSSSSSGSVDSILHPWEVLTPRSQPMVSPNKRYVAGLSPDCELLVMINPDRYGEDNDGGSHRDAPSEILWSTQRPYGNNGVVADHCFAMLKGPHLVVTVGQHPQQMGGSSSSSNHQNNRILWHSDGRTDEDDSRHGYYEYEDEFGFWHKRQRSYLAQLDNDGSLTVYSVWSVPQEDDASGGQQHRQKHSLGRPVPKALASNVARAAKDFWNGRIQTKNEFDHLYSTSRSLTYKRCVYSTHGVAGCYRISRRLHQFAFEATLAVRKCIFHINVFADTWLDLIYEEDDIFYFVKESIWKNTLGSKVAGSSTRWVRKVLEGIKQLSSKHQSRQ